MSREEITHIIRKADSLMGGRRYGEALEILNSIEGEAEGPLLGAILWRKGWILYNLRRLKEAYEYLRRAKDSVADARTRAFVLSALGIVSHTLKRFSEAVEYHSSAIELLGEMLAASGGDPGLMGDMAKEYNNRANALVGAGRYDEAFSDYGEAEAILSLLGDAPGLLRFRANLHYNVGSLHYYLNDISSACDEWRKAHSIYKRLCEDYGDSDLCEGERKLRSAIEKNC
ncbi:MAG: hypothetical protein GXO29_02780 [Thermotogae bacterium]|nr:hypothetical protein [Thermotogota bacterium]